MKYVPFETIEEVEMFYCHSVYDNKGTEFIVVGCTDSEKGIRVILSDATTEKEHIYTAEECLKQFTFIKRPFGKVVEE